MSRIRSARLFTSAYQAMDGLVRQGEQRYERGRNLSRLVPVGPEELADNSPETSRRVRLLLARALRRERALGRAGHWSYDLNRHIGLLQAYRAETGAQTCKDT